MACCLSQQYYLYILSLFPGLAALKESLEVVTKMCKWIFIGEQEDTKWIN